MLYTCFSVPIYFTYFHKHSLFDKNLDSDFVSIIISFYSGNSGVFELPERFSVHVWSIQTCFCKKLSTPMKSVFWWIPDVQNHTCNILKLSFTLYRLAILDRKSIVHKKLIHLVFELWFNQIADIKMEVYKTEVNYLKADLKFFCQIFLQHRNSCILASNCEVFTYLSKLNFSLRM